MVSRVTTTINRCTLLLICLLSTIFTPICAFAASTLSVSDFATETHLRDAEISPNGEFLASIWNLNEYRIVMLQSLKDPKQEKIYLHKDNIFRPYELAWANNDVLIIHQTVPRSTKYVIKKSKIDDDFSIYDYPFFYRTTALNIRTKNNVELLGGSHRFKKIKDLAVISNYLPDDPNHVLMRVQHQDKLALYKVNVNDGKWHEVSEGGFNTYRIITDNNGAPIYRLDYLRHQRKIEIFELEDEDDWHRIDTVELKQSEDERIRNGDLLSIILGDGNQLIYRKRNVETGYYELLLRKRGSEQHEVLVSIKNRDVEKILSNGRKNEIIGYTIIDDLIEHRYFDKNKQRIHDKIAKQVGFYNFVYRMSSLDAQHGIVISYGLDNPGKYYIFNKEKETITLFSDANLKLPQNSLSLPAITQIETRDGAKLKSYLLLPEGFDQQKPMPMVLLPHGGPHMRDYATYDDLAQFISTRGYIVLQPNFRGSSGYGKGFEQAGYKQWGELMQDDLTDAVQYMIKQGYADPNRICIVGGSYGGYAALMATIKTPNLFKCAVSINGVSHLVDQIDYDISEAGKYEEEVTKLAYERIGHPKKDRAKLDKNSPALHVDKVSTPILLIAGEDDEIVPIEQSELMAEALEEYKKPFKYIEIEDAGHNIFYNLDDLANVYTEIEVFLKKHLK